MTPPNHDSGMDWIRANTKPLREAFRDAKNKHQSTSLESLESKVKQDEQDKHSQQDDDDYDEDDYDGDYYGSDDNDDSGEDASDEHDDYEA